MHACIHARMHACIHTFMQEVLLLAEEAARSYAEAVAVASRYICTYYIHIYAYMFVRRGCGGCLEVYVPCTLYLCMYPVPVAVASRYLGEAHPLTSSMQTNKP